MPARLNPVTSQIKAGVLAVLAVLAGIGLVPQGIEVLIADAINAIIAAVFAILAILQFLRSKEEKVVDEDLEELEILVASLDAENDELYEELAQLENEIIAQDNATTTRTV